MLFLLLPSRVSSWPPEGVSNDVCDSLIEFRWVSSKAFGDIIALIVFGVDSARVCCFVGAAILIILGDDRVRAACLELEEVSSKVYDLRWLS